MRFYSSTAVISAVANSLGISATETNLVLTTNVGWPGSTPFTVRLDPSTSSEELVEITSGSGTNADPYIMLRGIDGTVAKVHATGAVACHSVSARDFSEVQQFMADAGGANRVCLVRPVADPSQVNSTTFVHDPYLTFPSEINSIYRIELTAGWLADPAVDVRVNWQVPAGATGTRYVTGIADGQNPTGGLSFNYATPLGVDVRVSGFQPIVAVLREIAVVKTSTTAGDIQLLWGQYTPGPSAVTIGAFAICSYEKLV